MPLAVLVVYSVLLYAAWTVYHFFILEHIENIPNDLLSSLLNDAVCKNLIWTLPAALLIHKYSKELEISPKEMFKWEKGYVKYLLIFPAFAAYIIFGMLVRRQPIELSIGIKDIVTVLFVGVTEELVFRAWLLNATAVYAAPPKNKDDTPWQQYAVIGINAVMFLAIHFPRWINEGVFFTNIASLGFMSILILSVIFSLLLLKTKNILLPITLHMFWDLLIFLLY